MSSSLRAPPGSTCALRSRSSEQAEAPEQLLGNLARRAAEARHRSSPREKVPGEAGVAQHDADADQHVLEHAERAVELRDLERAADAEAA
jgi:hypothetical protein